MCVFSCVRFRTAITTLEQTIKANDKAKSIMCVFTWIWQNDLSTSKYRLANFIEKVRTKFLKLIIKLL